MKTTHRELIKMACRILSTVYFSNDFSLDEEVQSLSNARMLLAQTIDATPKEFEQMLGHDIMEEIEND